MYYWSWSKTAGQHTITTSVINILRNWNHVGSLTWSYLPFLCLSQAWFCTWQPPGYWDTFLNTGGEAMKSCA